MNRWKGRSAPTGHHRAAASKAPAPSPSERKLLRWGMRDGLRDGERGILLEGSKLVAEALDAGHPITAAWFTHDFLEKGERQPQSGSLPPLRSRGGVRGGYTDRDKQQPTIFSSSPSDLLQRLRQSCDRLREVTPREMKQLSDLTTPPGVVAVAPEPGFIYRQPGDPVSLIVAVTAVQDPGNLGGIIRTADYFGVDEVWLGMGSADPYAPRVLRGSMGACFRMPVRRVKDLSALVRSFADVGAEVWAAAAHHPHSDLRISPEGSRILLLGGESRGLDAEELKLAQRIITLPGAGRSESLNLAVAAGILIYQATAGRFGMSK